VVPGRAADIGIQTRSVLGETLRRALPGATTMRSVSVDLHRSTGRTAGNGSLMRTGPVALAHLGDVARWWRPQG
jgi:hypothetical protein